MTNSNALCRFDSTFEHTYTILDVSNYNSYALPLSGGTLSSSTYGTQLTIERAGSPYYAAIGFKNSHGMLGYLAINTVNGAFVRYNADSTTSYTILDSSNSSVSKSGETLTVKINGTTQSLTNTNTTYSAGTGLSLSGTTFKIKELSSGAWFSGTAYVGGDGVMDIGRYIDFHPTSASTLDFNVRLDAGTGTTARTFTFADTAGTLLSSGNSSVSKSGETLTVKINGTSQSLTNTNTTYSANNGVGLSGTTFYNSGVRATTINGNYLRVNTNGTNADLTIPYATTANQLKTFSIAYNRPESSGGNGKQWERICTFTDTEVPTKQKWYGKYAEIEFYTNGYGSNGNYTYLGRVSFCVIVGGQTSMKNASITIKWQDSKKDVWGVNHFKAVVTDTSVEFFVLNDIWDTTISAMIIRNDGLSFATPISSDRYTASEFTTYCSGKTVIDAVQDTNIWVGNALNATKATQDSDGNAIKTTYLKLSGGTMTGNITLNNAVYLHGKNTGGTSYILAGLSGSNDFMLGYGTAGAGYPTFLDGNNIYLRYGTSRTTGFYLNSSGNVGIGTTSPSEKLTVNGTASAKGSFILYDSNNNDFTIYWRETNDTVDLYAYENSYHNMCLGTASSAISVGGLYWKASKGYWGIATDNPSYRLHVVGQGYFTSSLTVDTASATSAIIRAKTSTGSICIDCESTHRGIYDDTASKWLISTDGTNTSLGIGNVSVAGSLESTYYKIGNVSNNPYLKLVEFTNNKTWYVQGYQGYLYLGASVSSAVRIDSSGNIYSPAGVSCLQSTSSSDIRMKNVVSRELPLNIYNIANAPTIRFTWKKHSELGAQVGSIAQYWQQVLPEVVKVGNDNEHTLSLSYGVAALVAAITTARKVVDHEREIAQLKNRVKALEDENKMLKTKLIA